MIANRPPASLIPSKNKTLCPFFESEVTFPMIKEKTLIAKIMPRQNPMVYKIESDCFSKPKTGNKSTKCITPAKPWSKPIENEAKWLCFLVFLL